MLLTICLFSKQLHLTQFTFQAFVDSLSHSSIEPRCHLLHETFGAIVAIACREYTLRLSSNPISLPASYLLTSTTSLACHASNSSINATENGDSNHTSQVNGNSSPQNPLPSNDLPSQNHSLDINHSTTQSDASDEEKARELFSATLAKLNEDEQASIDQWYKWAPGRWGAHPGSLHGSTDNLDSSSNLNSSSSSSSASTTDGASSSSLIYSTKYKSKAAIKAMTPYDRLRAMEVALIGLLRDCLVEGRCARKWRTLATLIGAIQRGGSHDGSNGGGEDNSVAGEDENEDMDAEMKDSMESLIQEEDGGATDKKRIRSYS